ncbi:hypothetical protein FKM82_029066, partial [Ascaphus truei]
QFQGPIYTQGDSPSPLPPQGMIVQPEMHLSHPGLHPHQSPAPMPAPNLYPAPVSLSPGQPPPQQLLPPPYFTAPPAVMNFGSPSYPYAPAGLPPPPPAHLYPNAQVREGVDARLRFWGHVRTGITERVVDSRSSIPAVGGSGPIQITLRLGIGRRGNPKYNSPKDQM